MNIFLAVIGVVCLLVLGAAIFYSAWESCKALLDYTDTMGDT